MKSLIVVLALSTAGLVACSASSPSAPDEESAEDADGRLSGVSVDSGDAVPRAPAPNAHAAR
jgi:hypothetical protein